MVPVGVEQRQFTTQLHLVMPYIRMILPFDRFNQVFVDEHEGLDVVVNQEVLGIMDMSTQTNLQSELTVPNFLHELGRGPIVQETPGLTQGITSRPAFSFCFMGGLLVATDHLLE